MRANLLILVAAALALVIGLPNAVSREPVLRVQSSPKAAALTFFGFDTEGTEREARNLLVPCRFRGNTAQCGYSG